MKNIARILFVVIAMAVGGTAAIFFINLPEPVPNETLSGRDAVLKTKKNDEKSIVHLYFSDKKNAFLKAEQRYFPPSEKNPFRMGKLIVEGLIEGPRSELVRTIHEKTKLRALYITDNGTAYVDMARTIRDHHPGGAKSEMMTIYSIVNSVILNIPEVQSVKILIDGNEAETLAGHIGLRHPFKANMLIIR